MNEDELSKGNRVILQAYRKGYRVRDDGSVKGIRTDTLVTNVDGRGYAKFTMRTSPTDRYPVYVHRLQAYQKYGEKIFEDGIQVRHLDGNGENNSKDNVAIGTPSQNIRDIPKSVRIRCGRNAGRSQSPLSEKDVREIRERVKNDNYDTYQKLAEEYGLASKGTISDIVNYKIWISV